MTALMSPAVNKINSYGTQVKLINWKASFIALFLIANSMYSYGDDCRGVNTTHYVSSTFTIQQDSPTIIPVGAPLGGAFTNIVIPANCTSDGGLQLRVTLHIADVKPVTIIDGKQVFSTPIKGLGFALGAHDRDHTSQPCNSTTKWVPSSKELYLCPHGSIQNKDLQVRLYLQLYKISEELKPGKAQYLPIGGISVLKEGKSYGYTSLYMGNIEIVDGTCSLTTTSIKVKLPKTQKNLFTGINSSPSDGSKTDFNIPLTCNLGTILNIQIDGNTEQAEQGLLKLTPHTLAASGVGIQLLHKNTPVKLGTMFNVGTASAKGAFNIPISARYLQTQEEVKPGIANSTATFILKYY